MREEYWKAFLWLLVIGSWVFGLAYGRWAADGAKGFFSGLSVAHVPNPFGLQAWWQVLAYFTLSVAAIFVLSHVLFGVGAAIFLFARGIVDNVLILELESRVRAWTLPPPTYELWMISVIALILAVNLPLCLWASHLGTQRAICTWYRLRGEAVKPEFGARPFRDFLLILAASIAAGLLAAMLFSYAQQV